MATSVQESRLRLTATAETEAAFRKAARDTDQVTAAAKRLRAEMEANRRFADDVGRRFAGIGAGLFGLQQLKQSVQEYAAMERQFTRIGINAEASSSAINRNREMIYRLANETAQPINEMVNGFAEIVRATGDLKQAEELFPAVAKANQALGAQMTDTAKTAQVMNDTFKIARSDIPAAFDAIAKAGNSGTFEAKDLANYMKQLAPVMASVGYSGLDGLQKTVSLLEVISKQTGTAEESFTALRDVITRLATPEMEHAFAKQGTNLRAALDQARRTPGSDLVATFQNVTKETLKVMGYYRNIPASARESLLAALFPEKDSRAGMLALLQLNNQVVDMMDNVKHHSAGAIDEANKRLLDDAQSHIQRLENQWTLFKQQLGAVTYDLGGQLGIDAAAAGLEDLSMILKVIQVTAEKIRSLFPSFEDVERGKAGMSDKMFGTDLQKKMDEAKKGEFYKQEPLRPDQHPYVSTDALIQDLLPRIERAQRSINDARNQAFMSGSRDPAADARNQPGAYAAERELQEMQRRVQERTKLLTDQETKDFGRAAPAPASGIDKGLIHKSSYGGPSFGEGNGAWSDIGQGVKLEGAQLVEQRKTNELLYRMGLKNDLVIDRARAMAGTGGGGGLGGDGSTGPGGAGGGGGGGSGAGRGADRSGGGSGSAGGERPMSALERAGISETPVASGETAFGVDGRQNLAMQMRGGRAATSAGIGTIDPSAFASRGGDGVAPFQKGEGKTLFDRKAPQVMARLMKDFSLSKEDAAAILGNLGHESRGFEAFEEDGRNGKKGPGRGWAQWTDPGRKRRFFQYAREHNLDPHSDEANYGFLKWELTHTHKKALADLRRAQGLQNKVRAFEQPFEGAGVKAYGSRDNYANRAMAMTPGGAPNEAGGSAGAFNLGGFNMPTPAPTETPSTTPGGPSMPATNAPRAVRPDEGSWADGANLFSRGGVPGARPGQNLVTVTTGSGQRFTVHRDAAPGFKALADDLEKSGYKINSIGGYNYRTKRGGSGLSEHAYGNAIDINPSANPFHSGRTDMPDDIRQRAQRYGLSWGGAKDPMHFEWRGKPLPQPGPAGETPTAQDLNRSNENAYRSTENPLTRGRTPAAAPPVPDLSEHHAAIDKLHEHAAKPVTIRYNHDEGQHAALQSRLTTARDHREARMRSYSDVGVA